MSCGDDDKPFIPELNKLTSVTCTKNGNAFFNANITYDQDKQINRIILNTEGNQFTDNYIIVDKTISVSGVKMIDGSPTDPFVHTVYTLSGNMIAAKEEKSENKYMSNAVYTAVENRYTYSSNWLKSVSQIIQWPNEDGSGYQVRELGEVDRYSWRPLPHGGRSQRLQGFHQAGGIPCGGQARQRRGRFRYPQAVQ